MACEPMRGSGEGQGVRIPLLEHHDAIGFLSNTGPDPLEKSQSYQASFQCWANIGRPAKHHSSLAMSTSVLKALPGKLNTKRRCSPSILYL